MQLTLSCKVDGQICQVEVTGEVPQQAQNRPMEEAQFLKQMKKLGGTPFTWEQLDLCLEGTLFVPVGALNNLRRTGLEALQKALVERYWREQPKAKEPEEAVSLKKAAPQFLSHGQPLTCPSACQTHHNCGLIPRLRYDKYFP